MLTYFYLVYNTDKQLFAILLKTLFKPTNTLNYSTLTYKESLQQVENHISIWLSKQIKFLNHYNKLLKDWGNISNPRGINH